MNAESRRVMRACFRRQMNMVLELVRQYEPCPETSVITREA